MSENEENKSLVREGIKLLLNNKFEEAKKLFSNENEHLQMAAGYCFLSFINALMTFEEGKLEESLQTLKEIERKCSQDFGWLQSVKNKVLGYSDEDLVERLEKQVILADCHLCVALLTVLQQDLTSYMKGGWVLMKAWKAYLNTYTQILNLYKKTFGSDEAFSEGEQPSWEFVTKSASSMSLVQASKAKAQRSTVPNSPIDETASPESENCEASSSAPSCNNGASIEPYVVARLMASVSFGYGIFQLCISLLPTSFLKVIHFLGFEGGKEAGLSALKFSMEGDEMRRPLASLTLLWYHTIVRPFFAMDGSRLKPSVREAELLLIESEEDFGDSSLFLFFKGRVLRLKSNIPESIQAFELAIERSTQNEIQLLCLHEIGWCYLILLDWESAFHCFNQLRERSKWSPSMYAYLNMICMGALGDRYQAHLLAEEIKGLLPEEQSLYQVKSFIARRIRKVHPPEGETAATPKEEDDPLNEFTCKLFLLEILYFWNALPTCSVSDQEELVKVCQDPCKEPMPGLASLLEGAVHLCAPNVKKATECFRKCLEIRRELKPNSNPDSDDNDDHISAFASFELGNILVRKEETLEEGKGLLLQVQNDYKGYDFEYRLVMRLNPLLKAVKLM